MLAIALIGTTLTGASAFAISASDASSQSRSLLSDLQWEDLGCWSDTNDRAVEPIEGQHPSLTGWYLHRADALNKCAQAAHDMGMPGFCVQAGGWCAATPNMFDGQYDRYGPSTACADDGEGGAWANQCYQFSVPDHVKIAELQSAMEAVQAGQLQQDTAISNVQSALDTAQHDLQQQVLNVQAAGQADHQQQASAISAMQSDVAAVQNGLVATQSDLATALVSNAAQDERLATMLSDLAAAQSGLAAAQSELAAAQSDLATALDSDAAQDERLAALELQMANAMEKLEHPGLGRGRGRGNE